MPVIRSGTFIINGFVVDTGATDWFFDPTQWYNTLLGPPVPTTYMAGVTGASLLHTTTEGTNLPTLPPIAGFTPTTNCRIHIGLGGFGGVSPSVGTAQYSTVSFDLSDADPDRNKFGDNPTYIDLLSFLRIEITTHGASDAPFESTDASGLSSPASVTGNYDILAFWWTIPAVSACGDPQVPHHQLLAPDIDPGDPWVRLGDDDAAPVPTVDGVTPNHGPIAGGDPVTIDGSGFGDGCTVTFDGVPATSVVVVSQFQITCDAPAHAAGSAAVVVTNEDGVVSV